MDKQGLTLSGITLPHALLVLAAITMVGTSIYLTDHFYTTLYPTSLGEAKGLCDISSFWNCDVATTSKASNVAGVPISFFGVVVGLVLLAASIFKSPENDRTAAAVAKWNFLGCVALFVFSLVALGSLCPMCSLYYVVSTLAAFLFWRHGDRQWLPDPRRAAIWAVVVIVGGFFFHRHTSSKAQAQDSLSAQVVGQYRALAEYGDPDTESPFKIHAATPSFADAPIRVSVFSDFQCPFCQRVADQLHPLVRKYADKINVQYLFYPLDSACNPNVKSAMHEYACRAAMLAACDPAKFVAVHDDIFAAQEGLNLDVLKGIADKHGLSECFNTQATRDAVLTSINQATKYNLRSTPTLIINGRKIEGSVPNPQLEAIFQDLLKK